MIRRPSIRVTLLLTIGLLATLIALMAVHEVSVQWQRVNQIQKLKYATPVNEHFFDAIEYLSREREVTFAILQAKDPEVAQRLRANLEQSRHNVDAILKTMTEELLHYPPDMVDNPMQTIAMQQAKLSTLRGQIDHELLQTHSLRDKGLARHWLADSTDILNQTFDGWMGFTRRFTEIDPIVTQRIMFQHFLGLIIRYSGRERALVGGLLVADEPVSSSDQALLLQWHGVIGQGWEMCARLSERSQLAPAITPYLEDARSHYLTVYDMVQGLFYVPGAPPVTAYPIDIEQWLEVSAGSTDSLVALKDAALRQTREYVATLKQQAQRAIIIQLAILLVASLLCLISFGVVTRRVIEPIRQMITALLDTAAGRPIAPLPLAANRHDEIAQLAQVLFSLQKHTEVRSLLAAIVESSDDAIISYDLNGIITSWNRGAEHLFSYTAMEAVGKHIGLIIPPERKEEEGEMLAQLQKGQGVEHFETVRIGKQGQRIDVSLTASLVVNPQGTVIGISKILRDIRAHKKAEERLQRYMQDLEHSNKELDDFAYIASHDLKEPLRGIHNHSRFLLEDNEEKLEKESVDRLHRLLYLTQRMEKLVNDLLYFSRLGRQQLAIQPTDLNIVVHDIETMIDVFLTEHQAKIVIPTPLPVIVCDKTRITEALRNLITNAVKYNDKTEKIVEIGLLTSRVTPEGEKLQDVYYVKDNGVGIPLEFYKEVFRIFKRLQSSKQDGQEEGTGVGLTFVKKIIERHGGRIWLESELGQGTVFYFTLEKGSYAAESTQ
jgi:PAS domain S-box-containing protein